MARMKKGSSLNCIPSAAVVRMELERKRQEAEALEFLLRVSQEVERRRAAQPAVEPRKTGVAHVG